jgi:predicted NBD/HSP70 family sugar kinase
MRLVNNSFEKKQMSANREFRGAEDCGLCYSQHPRPKMADQTLAKFINELRILTLLRTEGRATRADMARRLKLTPATITRLVNSLAKRQLLRDVQDAPDPSQPREAGRPGVSVALDAEGAYFLGVEIGVGVLRFALVNMRTDIVESAEVGVSASIEPQEAVAAIAAHLGRLLENQTYRGRIRSLGVTVPGLVNSQGHIVHLPILGWRDVNLLERLEAEIAIPAYVDNNADAAAFGSVYTRPPASNASIIYLKLGTGCGGAAIIGGRLLRGSAGMAAEFGHIRISDGGERCYCGQTGCLETFVNLRALGRSWLGAAGLDEAAFAELPDRAARAAEAGEAAAIFALEQLCLYLAKGIVSLVNIFNPAAVMLGGPLRPAIAGHVESIRRQVAAAIVPGMTVPVISLSSHGKYECAIGAASVAHHHSFDVPWRELANGQEDDA